MSSDQTSTTASDDESDKKLSPRVRKAARYTLVSAVAVGVSQGTLLVAFGLLRWSAVAANILATAIATVPSYALNRAWVWRKGGRSHLVKELLPFWALAFLGLALSTLAAAGAERWAETASDARGVQTLIVSGSTLAAFGVLWIAKFAILERLLFGNADISQ